MGLFGSSRSRAEKGELKKAKRTLKSARRATKRELRIGELKDRTRLLKAESAYKKAKHGEKKKSSRPLFDITVNRKRQNKKISRKMKIRLI